MICWMPLMTLSKWNAEKNSCPTKVGQANNDKVSNKIICHAGWHFNNAKFILAGDFNTKADS